MYKWLWLRQHDNLASGEKWGACLIRELRTDMIYHVHFGRLPIDCPSAYRVKASQLGKTTVGVGGMRPFVVKHLDSSRTEPGSLKAAGGTCFE